MRIDRRIMNIAAATALAACALAAPGAVAAQGAGSQAADLERQIDGRFAVLPITGGVVLTPRTPIPGVKSIELAGGTISIDGVPVTGGELRQKLGADADVVLQLSYLSPADQRSLAAGQPRAEQPQPNEPRPNEPPPPSRRDRSSGFQFRPSGRRGDQLHVGRDMRVDAGEVIDGNVVSIGGSTQVFGEVHGDAVSVGGTVELGPSAVVSRNVVSVGGRVIRDPGARVGGEVREIGWGTARFSDAWRRSWTGGRESGAGLAAPLALVAVILRTFVLCLLALLIVLVAGRFVERTGERAATEPLKSGAVGFLAAVLFLPVLIITIIILVVTIIGIPLLLLVPFALLGLLLVSMVGFTAISLRVGRFIGARLSWAENPYVFTALGVVALLTPAIVLRLVGLGAGGLVTMPLALLVFCAECIVWMIGFGAVALAWFSKTPAGLTPTAP